MKHRFAMEPDLDLLAEWNHQLIQDEGHRNRMTVSELRERMQGWLAADYTAVLFANEAEPVAYTLYRETSEEIYLRQFFVRRDSRRMGLGRQAMIILREEIWPPKKRLTVDVLSHNTSGIQFWRSVGYKDYCLTLEITPEG